MVKFLRFLCLYEYCRRMCTLSKYVKNESRIVSPTEIREIHPHLNTDKIIGGLYAPNDGSVDPTGECIYPRAPDGVLIIAIVVLGITYDFRNNHY